jgi:hypothetical protein
LTSQIILLINKRARIRLRFRQSYPKPSISPAVKIFFRTGPAGRVALVMFAVMFHLYTDQASADSLTIMAVGDIMMGSDYPDNHLPPNDGQDLLMGVDYVLRTADLTLGNLEGPLASGGTCTKTIEKGKCYAFRTPPAYVKNLIDAGFDFLNCANNHANDFGYAGVTSTHEALADAGIQYGGPDISIGDFEINGRKIVVLPFSVSSGIGSIFEVESAQRLVAEKARDYDIVIVSFHGGGEGVRYLHTVDTFEYYMGWPRGNVVRFARAVVDSGADLVWGHGPHVPRALEIRNGRLIAYSLGNFCTWGFNLGDERGYAPILKAVLDSTGAFLHGEIISALQRTCTYPVIDDDNLAARLMQRLSREDFPETAPDILDDGTIRLRSVPEGHE